MVDEHRIWAEELDSPLLPAATAEWFARNGDEGERWRLTANRSLPLSVLRLLAEDDDRGVSTALLLNHDLPGELVARIRARWPDPDTRMGADSHPNAPVEVKLATPVVILTATSLDRFFDSVQATHEQRRRLTEGIRHRDDRTLGEAWRDVIA